MISLTKNSLQQKIQIKYIKAHYYFYFPILRDKIKDILRYDEKSIDLSSEQQEEQALPGFRKYKNIGYHRYMFARYLYSIKFIRNRFVLDAGCGLGWGSYLISDYTNKVVGIDINSEALNFAKRHWKHDKLEFMELSVLELQSLGKRFDVVLSYEVIEHLSFSDGKKFIEQSSKILNQGGRLILSSYFPDSQKEAKMVEERNPFHLHIYTKKEIKDIVKEYRFSAPKFFGNLIINVKKL